MQSYKKKVSIIYGFTEGSWQGKKLRAELHKSGYVITKKPEDADIIIAHSGGCYMLPSESKALLVLLVGLPYNKNIHPAKSLNHKLKNDIKTHWWFKNLMFNSLYFFTRPTSWIKIWRAWAKQTLPSGNQEVIALRNQKDSFLHPTDLIDLNSAKNWTLASLSGHHDDIWVNPKPYVDIINGKLKHV